MAGTLYSLIIALLLGLLWLMVRWARRQRAQRDSSSTPALRHREPPLIADFLIIPPDNGFRVARVHVFLSFCT